MHQNNKRIHGAARSPIARKDAHLTPIQKQLMATYSDIKVNRANLPSSQMGPAAHNLRPSFVTKRAVDQETKNKLRTLTKDCHSLPPIAGSRPPLQRVQLDQKLFPKSTLTQAEARVAAYVQSLIYTSHSTSPRPARVLRTDPSLDRHLVGTSSGSSLTGSLRKGKNLSSITVRLPAIKLQGCQESEMGLSVTTNDSGCFGI